MKGAFCIPVDGTFLLDVPNGNYTVTAIIGDLMAHLSLIDLASRSKALFEQYGDEASKSLFMWAYPGEFISFPDGAKDDTHFQEMGGILVAGLVAEGIRELELSPLHIYLKPL